MIFKKGDKIFFNKLSKFIKKSDTIYLELDVMRFGKYLKKKISKENYLNFFFKLLTRLVGKKGNIIIPSFSYSWGSDKKSKIFNHKFTKSQTGIFPEYFRKQRGVERTDDPMFSCLVYGKNKNFFLNNYEKNSFGKNSIYAKIYEKNAKLISFGLNKFDPTFVHYVEQYFDENIRKISYRKLKKFNGFIVNSKGKKYKDYQFCFMKPMGSKISFNEKNIRYILQKKKMLKQIKILNTDIFICNSKDFFENGLIGLRSNQKFFTKN